MIPEYKGEVIFSVLSEFVSQACGTISPVSDLFIPNCIFVAIPIISKQIAAVIDLLKQLLNLYLLRDLFWTKRKIICLKKSTF